MQTPACRSNQKEALPQWLYNSCQGESAGPHSDLKPNLSALAMEVIHAKSVFVPMIFRSIWPGEQFSDRFHSPLFKRHKLQNAVDLLVLIVAFSYAYIDSADNLLTWKFVTLCCNRLYNTNNVINFYASSSHFTPTSISSQLNLLSFCWHRIYDKKSAPCQIGNKMSRNLPSNALYPYCCL